MAEKDPSGTTDNSGGKTQENEGEDGGEKVSFESHKKLLGEKKKLAKDLSDIKAKLDELEQEKLESQGKLKESNENLKKQLKEAQDKGSSVYKKFSEKFVKQQFSREAEKLGCVDADLAYLACDIDDIDIDENFEFEGEQLTKKLEALAKSKPHLFKKDVSKPKTVDAKNGADGIDLKGLSKDELVKLI